MPKKNLLISAALTAFILVLGTGIASAYQRVNASIEAVKVNATADAARVAQVQPLADTAPVQAAAQPVQAALTHQDAALVAANFLGQTDLYSVENVVWEGVDAYKVVFSSGDVVYVNMNGDVIGTEAPETVVVIESNNTTSNTNARSNNNVNTNTNNNNTSTSSYHEDEHEEHDD